jgi:CheY-like chemotaxis protein
MARILIADDEPQVRNAVVSIVKGGGHETFETFDGLGALMDVKELKPDLVLLDWMIPELFGGEVLDKLRNDPDYADVKDTIVIVVSDFTGDSNRDEFMRAGANAYVPKRDNLHEMKDELLSTISQLLEGTK